MVPNLSELRQKKENKLNITCSEINLTNEPNMIADPQRFCEEETCNIIRKHNEAIHGLYKDSEKLKQQRIRTKIKTFNPIQMEKEMITPLPCYLQ
ncbi:unnamed protein product [Moneuplotes crassus]|uniref:Uncharacterized protein n=1 Tax=Euplotes crassus TaxID=5936 RepID=A0AAD1USK0_EUPCR|nr:unnamed protein product [Moneuplotes crassus]